ncbi:4Fe-4S binding protein, partial [bacterium]|nr:4Fe-4S binding protein [bacterium]
LEYSKYIFLIIIILGVIIFKKPILCGLDPFGVLFFKFITLASIISLILLVIIDIFIPRVFCRYFCPYGAILSLLHKLRLFK